jgi:hypothetical protein
MRITEPILLAAVPIATAAVAFTYEQGSASFYGIPPRLVSLNWTTTALSLLAVFVVYQGAVSWGYLSMTMLRPRGVWLTPKRLFLYIPFFIMTVAVVIQHGTKSFATLSAAIVFVMIIITDLAMIAVQKFLGRKSHRLETTEENEDIDPLKSAYNRVALLGIWSLMLLTLAYSTGYARARDQIAYLVVESSGYQPRVLLRSYGDLAILASLTQASSQFGPALYFERLGSTSSGPFYERRVGPLSPVSTVLLNEPIKQTSQKRSRSAVQALDG